MLVDTLSVVSRALGLVALFQAAGCALFIALQEPEPTAADPSVRRLGTLSALLAAVLIIAHYLLEAARMSGELSGVMDPTLQRLLARSPAGVALSWRLLGLLLILIGLNRGGTAAASARMAGVVVLLAGFSFIGHTASSAHRWLLSPVLLLHLFAVTFWFGGLLPLYLVSARESAVRSGQIVGRFSARAVWLVPALLIAGLLLAAGLLPDLAALRTPYGELLIVKVLGFCVLMLLASLNRWRLGPALPSGGVAAARRFQRTVVAEYALLVIILCVTAVLTSFYSPDGT